MTSEVGGGVGEVPRKRKRLLCSNGNNNLLSSTSTDKTFCFNDSLTADVKLHLHLYDDESCVHEFDLNHRDEDEDHLYLHSDILCRRSQYFSALLSDRWQREQEEEEEGEGESSYFNLTYKVPASMKSIDTHRIVIELLYSTDDNYFSETINTVSSALSILPVAMEFVFEDCIKACIQLIEALPWTEGEEEMVLDFIPLLKQEESQELLSRVKLDSSDEISMLLRWIQELRVNGQKDFFAKMLREFSSRDSVRLALNQAFEINWKLFKQVVQSACSSERQRQVEEEETVSSSGGYLHWLIGRMLELRVADVTTLDKWTDQQGSLTENLLKVCSDDTILKVYSDNTIISPRCIIDVIVCTWNLADAVATGSIVANRQVRIKLLKVWLPVVLRVKDKVLPIVPEHPVLNRPDFESPF